MVGKMAILAKTVKNEAYDKKLEEIRKLNNHQNYTDISDDVRVF